VVTDCTNVLVPTNCPPWDPQFVCYAHQRGVRVIRWPLFLNETLLTNYTVRYKWIQEEIALTKSRFWDGINIDWELGMDANDTISRLKLTEFVNDVADIFRIVIPGAKISFDAPYSPTYPNSHNGNPCVFERCYDYVALSNILDYLFIMDYDIYVWNQADCHSYPNAGLPDIMYGIDAYLALGVDPQKIIAGLPWYGYYYFYCILPPNVTQCPLPYYSDGVCMVDRSRTEITYATILSYWKPLALSHRGGELWDDASSSPYIYWYDTTGVNLHHIWYDNPKSLTMKLNSLKQTSILGVGMFAITEIDLSNKTQVQQMWAPFNNWMN